MNSLVIDLLRKWVVWVEWFFFHSGTKLEIHYQHLPRIYFPESRNPHTHESNFLPSDKLSKELLAVLLIINMSVSPDRYSLWACICGEILVADSEIHNLEKKLYLTYVSRKRCCANGCGIFKLHGNEYLEQ